MNKKRGIIYVNFSPYDNAGRILDFLVEHFYLVIHFSYDHLRLKNGRNTNILTVYKDGHITSTKMLIPIRTPSILRFPSLPLVALLILIQTWWHARYHQRRYGVIDYYFTVNAYTAWVGLVLKKLGVVAQTVFWVWDYFPPGYPDWRIRLLRWAYWKFDKPSILATDKLAFISDKLMNLRHDFDVLPTEKTYSIIPIGTNPIHKLPHGARQTKSVVIGFMGMLKESQGLDFILDAMPTILDALPRLTVEIIGSGPEEDHFRQRAKEWRKNIKFLGFIPKETDLDRIIRRWTAGLALYLPTPSNESYWTDPSKIKTYISQGVPVITTAVPYFAQEITKHKAGIVIEYGDARALLHAIGVLSKNQAAYRKRAWLLSKHYAYHALYKKLFQA